MSKNIKLIISALCLFLCCSLPVRSADTLRVMTYNLRFGELATLEQLGEYIKSKDPDVVALQECDWKTKRSRAPHQAGKAFVNELAYYTGLFGLYGKAIKYSGGYYGIGLLSKYPIVKSERYYLPNPEPRTEQRVILVAELEKPDNSRITFISTHLEVSSAKTRKAQIEFINSKIKEFKTPVILAGDFNATPKEPEIKNGFPKWFNATDTTYTFSSTRPSIKIDYIYGYPKASFELLSTKVDESSKLSDHFPVISNLIIKDNKSR